MENNKKNNLNIPNHVGIILDGNRRYAKSQGLPRLEGHRRGLVNLKTIAKAAFSKGIKILTVYAFSTENWNRDKTELNYLMKLFKIFVNREVKTLIKQGVKINFFGRLTDFNIDIQKDIKKVENQTRQGLGGILNICLSYGGRDELVRAFKKIISKKIVPAKISEKLIEKNLDSAGIPDPDLVIRTSGEQRLSGFLTWQSVYSELYFTKKYWPEFKATDLALALQDYSKRHRRFGGN